VVSPVADVILDVGAHWYNSGLITAASTAINLSPYARLLAESRASITDINVFYLSVLSPTIG
jgi:hypothetical protein